jgi:hypothetical protein
LLIYTDFSSVMSGSVKLKLASSGNIRG